MRQIADCKKGSIATLSKQSSRSSARRAKQPGIQSKRWERSTAGTTTIMIEEAERSAAAAVEATDETNCEGPSLAAAYAASGDAGGRKALDQLKKMSVALPKQPPLPKRSFEEELAFLKKLSPTRYQVKKGFVPNMRVDAEVIVNDDLEQLLLDELKTSVGEVGGCCGDGDGGGGGGFTPALRQVANVAALPGIVKASMAMPDVHSGYGFCIGNVAAFDMDDPDAIISPGGVGFDINCGVRLIRTNLTEEDVTGDVREQLAQALFDHIPVGVGTKGIIPVTPKELDEVLLLGVDWAMREGYAWPEVSATMTILRI